MLSRSILRSAFRALPRTIPRPLPRTPFPRVFQEPTPLIVRRFASRGPRIKHYRYNPEEVQRAKPLLTGEQIRNGFRHPGTKVLAVVVLGGGIYFYVSHLETVPVSGRRRFNCYSEDRVEEEGKMMYNMIMQQDRDAILPAWDPRTRMVQRVMNKLIPASGLEHVNWEVHVIESKEANAFVIPGGKVFVYSGILPIAKNDDGLAAILGHEISHNLAQHAGENMSRYVLLEPVRWVFIFLDYAGYTGGLGRFLGDILMDLGMMRPASRRQESEADYIGLMMMARSCYNPDEAVKVWERMEKFQKAAGNSIPQWLSTHPSDSTRIAAMTKWLPSAEEARSESECAVTLGYSKDFQKSLGQSGIWSDLFR
ncbi:hypothetical protein L207DRAFT_630927 [Hyaloscypha variabilis F]|uniref:Peptidase M48 domain-containing protein n=1 Tax=Hyaloscypha variabilis (strain UAMH 11265 / GT02V1 / F) TaxID=1149755 RepID=A0A2J6S1H8_HYAVF|nr:hypothetical protein L207DRAFT_630927 [Hyaloscypha variabilis F]